MAGFGDVLKHVVLTTVIRELQKEHTDDGILLVDCHAGDGVYDLNQHVKPMAYQKGILKVLEAYDHDPDNAPVAIRHFVDLVKTTTGCTSAQDLDVYPGSPVLGQNLLRNNVDVKNNVDEHRLMDLTVEDVQWLKQPPADFRALTDAYESVQFIMPFTHGGKHPIIFIDPDYDKDSDYGNAKKLLSTILDQHPFATVIVTIPLLQNHKFRWSYATGLREIAKTDAKTGRYFCSIVVAKDGCQGSAVLVCNPTPALDVVLDDHCIHWLAHVMNLGKDEFVVEQSMKKKKV